MPEGFRVKISGFQQDARDRDGDNIAPKISRSVTVELDPQKKRILYLRFEAYEDAQKFSAQGRINYKNQLLSLTLLDHPPAEEKPTPQEPTGDSETETVSTSTLDLDRFKNGINVTEGDDKTREAPYQFVPVPADLLPGVQFSLCGDLS